MAWNVISTLTSSRQRSNSCRSPDFYCIRYWSGPVMTTSVLEETVCCRVYEQSFLSDFPCLLRLSSWCSAMVVASFHPKPWFAWFRLTVPQHDLLLSLLFLSNTMCDLGANKSHRKLCPLHLRWSLGPVNWSCRPRFCWQNCTPTQYKNIGRFLVVNFRQKLLYVLQCSLTCHVIIFVKKSCKLRKWFLGIQSLNWQRFFGHCHNG